LQKAQTEGIKELEKEILSGEVTSMRQLHSAPTPTPKTLAKIAVGATIIAMGVIALFPSDAQSANPADIAQLRETGICKSCDLSGADLTGEHLIGADLRDANLTGTQLSYTNLEGADLTGATLIDTDFTGAFLTNALLDNTVIRNVDFSESTLIYTSLEGASIDTVDLVGAQVINTPISIGGGYEE
ncbi:MAG: pentapeptide repeat-containing protein, partial [Cyanobacteria bacterium J06631_9]